MRPDRQNRYLRSCEPPHLANLWQRSPTPAPKTPSRRTWSMPRHDTRGHVHGQNSGSLAWNSRRACSPGRSASHGLVCKSARTTGERRRRLPIPRIFHSHPPPFTRGIPPVTNSPPVFPSTIRRRSRTKMPTPIVTNGNHTSVARTLAFHVRHDSIALDKRHKCYYAAVALQPRSLSWCHAWD